MNCHGAKSVEKIFNDFEDDAMHATSFCSGVVVSKLREMARRRHGSIDKLVGNSAMLAQH